MGWKLPQSFHFNHSTVKKGCIQIIQLSEVTAKNEFLNMKNVSGGGTLAAHRVPPQMMRVMPNNVGVFGDAEKARKCFFEMNCSHSRKGYKN
ncbi:TPA: hypothetical protein MB364_002182 [Klebsiella variicola subsp. variicola]|nr:hypothetical protein [Klebsiella variicola subsp. variicola]